MEPSGTVVAAQRFWEGGRGAVIPEAAEVELGKTVVAGHRRFAAPMLIAGDAFVAVDLAACVADLEAAVRGLVGGTVAVDPQPVGDRWRPVDGSTAAVTIRGRRALVFNGLADGGVAAVVSAALTTHPTAPMYAAVGVYADAAGPMVRFGMVESMLPLFVRAERPRSWFGPSAVANAVVVLGPQVGLDDVLVRATMYRIAARVTDSRVGTVHEAYDPRHLGAIARRCVHHMPQHAAAAGDTPPPPPQGSPLRREAPAGTGAAAAGAAAGGQAASAPDTGARPAAAGVHDRLLQLCSAMHGG